MGIHLTDINNLKLFNNQPAENELNLSFCGVGTREARRRLAKMSLTNSRALLYKEILRAITDEEDELKYDVNFLKLCSFKNKISCLYIISKLCGEFNFNNGYTISDYVIQKNKGYYIHNKEDSMFYNVEIDGKLFAWHCHTFKHNIGGIFIGKEKKSTDKLQLLEKIILSDFPEITNLYEY